MSEENIQVVVRSRPLNSRERKLNNETIVSKTSEGNDIIIRTGAKDAQAFRCNAVFTGDCSQEYFFSSSGIINLLDSAISGYRSCAFAYGQTGAGKTHTMVGATTSVREGDDSNGVMGRSMEYLYSKLASLNIEYTVRISCFELYQENIYDLLVDEKDRGILQVREHPTDGFFVEGSMMVPCKNINHAYKVIDRALKSRHVGSHDYNHRSNRSHFITEVYIELPGQGAHLRRPSMEEAAGMTGFYDEMEEDREYTVMGRMTFVDLAGSERLKETNSKGKVLHETGSINKSLYVLGKVIAGMAKSNGLGKKEVPFRDSKLTKLLINSLGGASRTMMISCVSESSGALSETLRTLRFSMSAARIRNKPIRFLDPQEKLIMELREEIKRLRNENKQLRGGLEDVGSPAPTADPMKKSVSESNVYSAQPVSSSSRAGVRKVKSQENVKMTKKVSAGEEESHSSSPLSYLARVDSYVPVMQQKRRERTDKEQMPRQVSRRKIKVKKNNPLPMPDDTYDIHGRLKNPPKVAAKKVTPRRHQISLSPKKSPMRGSTSAPVIRIKEGSGKPRLSKDEHKVNPYLSHIKKKRAAMPRRQLPPPSPPDSERIYHRDEHVMPPIKSAEPSKPKTTTKQAHGFSVDSQEALILPNIDNSERSPKRVTSSAPVFDSDNLQSSVNSVKEKLVRMEAQLEARRDDINKNPATATPDKWAKLEALEEEVRDMKLEVQISEQLQGLSRSMGMSKSASSSPSKIDPFGSQQPMNSIAEAVESEDVVRVEEKKPSADKVQEKESDKTDEEEDDNYEDDAYEDEGYDEEFEEEDNGEEAGKGITPSKNNDEETDKSSSSEHDMADVLNTQGSLSYSRTSSPATVKRQGNAMTGTGTSLETTAHSLYGEKLLQSPLKPEEHSASIAAEKEWVVGDKISANYGGEGEFFPGVVCRKTKGTKGFLYDIEYDDGDKETGVSPHLIVEARKPEAEGPAAAVVVVAPSAGPDVSAPAPVSARPESNESDKSEEGEDEYGDEEFDDEEYADEEFED